MITSLNQSDSLKNPLPSKQRVARSSRAGPTTSPFQSINSSLPYRDEICSLQAIHSSKRMKNGCRLAVLALLAAVGSNAATVQTKFDYNFTGTVRCSETVTTSCLEKFEAGTFKDGVFTSLGSSALPAGDGHVTGIVGPSFELAALGSNVIAVVMVAKDATGARITSDPAAATSTVMLKPGEPNSLTVNVTVKVAVQ